MHPFAWSLYLENIVLTRTPIQSYEQGVVCFNPVLLKRDEAEVAKASLQANALALTEWSASARKHRRTSDRTQTCMLCTLMILRGRPAILSLSLLTARPQRFSSRLTAERLPVSAS